MISLQIVLILVGYLILSGMLGYIGEEIYGAGLLVGLFWPVILPIAIGWKIMSLILEYK